MRDVTRHLTSELGRTLERIRQADPAYPPDEVPAVIGTEPGDEEPELGSASAEREMSFARRSRLMERARRLTWALERIEHGDYGRCEECGGPIAPRRLAAMPEATTCVRCQERLERRGRGAPPGRGSLA